VGSARGECPACRDQLGQLAWFRRNGLLSRPCFDPDRRSPQPPHEANSIGEDFNAGQATNDAVTLGAEIVRGTGSPEIEAAVPAFHDPSASRRASDPESSLQSDLARPAKGEGCTRVPAGLDWVRSDGRHWRGVAPFLLRSLSGIRCEWRRRASGKQGVHACCNRDCRDAADEGQGNWLSHVLSLRRVAAPESERLRKGGRRGLRPLERHHEPPHNCREQLPRRALAVIERRRQSQKPS
jgi:hypothetical protein